MEDLSVGHISKSTCTERGASLVCQDEFIAHDRHEAFLKGASRLLHRASRVVRCTLGCWHRHISRPFTLWGHTYEVCLDCGKEFPYSLEQMSRVRNIHFASTRE